MARGSRTTTPPPEVPERILDVDVSEEMQGSYLEYAYSVIYSRALPDARDGLKPVHRRIVYQMGEMGLRPDRGHVKSARVVGEVMGRLHPHGDGAIYDALVRMAQPFSMRLPLVDGHGNFGSPDAGPAAMRYTECRPDAPAMLLLDGIDEDTVDFRPNYDGQEQEPEVLPAAFPNLLVNGASGIAVGMATNMAPHNLGEVIAAARHLIASPDASLDDLMRFVPGPDLPSGGRIVGLEGVREAYETGRGTFRTRATTSVESITARRKGIVVTEFPWGVGPERVKEKIGELVRAKKLQGISDVEDLTDAKNGTRLVIEVKNGFVPEAVLEQLYRLTPMEESFGINNVALVDGQPRTLGLRELLQVYVDHRTSVVRRRSVFRRRKREDRLHLVLGMLIAIVDIDEVIAIVRTSDDTAQARQRLMTVFDLSEVQATYILDMPLRRLTRYSRIELETERDQLQSEIDELTAILEDERRLRRLVSSELAEVAKNHATPRRTVLLESAGLPVKSAAVPLEVADDPCFVLLSTTGLLARTTSREPLPSEGERVRHDALVSSCATTARGEIGLVTTAGRLLRLPVIDLPALPPVAGLPSLAGGAPVSELLPLEAHEQVLAVCSLSAESVGLALGTAQGIVKRVVPEYPATQEFFPVIRLEPGDRVVGAVELVTGQEELVFVTSDAQLLRFGAEAVRPQGRAGGGIAGVRLAAKQSVVFFGAVDPSLPTVVVTLASSTGALPGTGGSVKVAPFTEYPAKGRATGGVRAHRFLRGEDSLALAWVGPAPARGAAATGMPVDLPAADGRRDGSGVPSDVAAVGGTPLGVLVQPAS
ncbi:DNA gyrase subunit A [Motilibacter peucedani]|uniref:DNA topoisomerase (ATP-hydrolyzing) n=1 Tax=Motilibacter peucedani TaxID=598650 RepID=A0A420XS15_9ACTN|nr:DNA topoisomerase IV subunit A [Motilibacter peucedani]RKS77610.1 DNA gyrase subunit A [Motilibacter peucedani]